MFISKQYQLFSIIITILGLIWIAISSIYFEPTANFHITAPKEGFSAPEFTLESKEGKTYQLSDYRGRPILINIWASWCAPCKAEMPAMEKIFQKYKNQGFSILAVNATNQDNVDAAIQFTDSLGLTFPILLDVSGDVVDRYQVSAFPSSYFIDKDGQIQEIVIGGPMSEAFIQTRVETLLEVE